MHSVDFLRAIHLGEPIKVGQKVAVTGGGNSAMDAARVAVRKGAKEVHILYRRNIQDMPAEEEEITAAQQEGIHIHTSTVPVRVQGENGRVTGVECVRLALKDFDSSGRRAPEPITGSEYVLDIDMLIEAVGHEPETANLCTNGVERQKDGRVKADPRTLLASEKGVFAAGDAFLGPATVTEAIASGQRAASSIRKFLNGEELSPLVCRNGYKPIEFPDAPPTEAETRERPRVTIHELPLKERKTTFEETILSYSSREARDEASRCLRCDMDSNE
jgi:heterodisulfide reductase subunit A